MTEEMNHDRKEQQEEEKGKPKQSSVLFERYMGWFVLVLLLGAIWYKNQPLIIVSAFLFTISLVISFWKKKALQGLIPTIELSRTRVFAGDRVKFICTLSNKKWLPLVWLEWELIQQKGLSFLDGEKGNYHIRLLWLLGYRSATWDIEGYAIRRGVYPVGKLVLRSGDAFRFAETESHVDLQKDLYIYPKLLPVQVPSLHHVFQWGMSGKRGGLLEDPSHISGIREYQTGDEWRKIHWQASARTGTLQTWVYQPVLPRQLYMGIDVEGFAGRNDEEFERFLSIIASAAFSYHRQGIWIGHATNGLTVYGVRIHPIPPSQSITPCMDDLARMTSEQDTHSERLWEDLMPKGRIMAPIYYFSYQIDERHVRWLKKNKKAAPHVIFFYYRKSQYTELLRGQAKPMESLHPFSQVEGANG